MTNPPVFCSGCALIDDSGIHTIANSQPWESDQDGPAAIRRTQVLEQPYMAFGKLNLPDKLAFSAGSLVLRESTVYSPETTGIFLGIPSGSHSTDLLYKNSVEEGSPSPAYFSATLPSSPVADIAIYYKVKGPDIIFPGGDSPLLSAIESAQFLLQQGKLSGALILLAEETTGNPGGSSDLQPFAFALHLQTGVPGDTTAPSFHYHFGEVSPSPKTMIHNDRSLATTLFALLRKKQSERITVPIHGFKGYISLQYT